MNSDYLKVNKYIDKEGSQKKLFSCYKNKIKESRGLLSQQRVFSSPETNLSLEFITALSPFILSTLHAHSFCTTHLSEWLVAKPFSLFQGDFDGRWHLHRKMDGLRRILLSRVDHSLPGRLGGHLQLAWH